MAGKPIATVGSNHTCPMCSGTVPHVGGPITQGETNILINKKPVATIGSMCTCVGPPDTIVQGNSAVLFNGKPVACLGDMTAHGGVIISGEVNVTISANTETPKVAIQKKQIPFPKITIIDKIQASAVGQGQKLKEAQENQEQLAKENDNHGYLMDANFSV